MAAKKSWVKILFGLGCGALLFGACVMGVLVLLFMGESPKLVPLETEDWADYLGKKANKASLPHCKLSWAVAADGKTMTCDVLFKYLPFAIAEQTGGTVHLDKNGHIEAFELELHGHSRFQVLSVEDKDVYDVWHNAARAQMDKQGCTEQFSGISTSRLWQCGDSMGLGFAEPIFMDIDNALDIDEYRGYLWIGKTAKKLEPYAQRRGEFVARQHALLSINAADIVAKKGFSAMADKSYISAAYYSLLAGGTKKSAQPVPLKDIASKRRKIHASVMQEHRMQDSEPPLPAGDNRLLDLPFLLNKTQGDMEALLGKSRGCKTVRMASVGSYPRCRYGDKLWSIDVSFIKKRSSRVAATFHPDILEYRKEALVYLHIPMRDPAKSTSKKMTWKSIANFKELSIEKQKNGYVVVSAIAR